MKCIGIDLGTSFIKGAVLDLDALAIRHIERLAFPEPIRGVDPAFREFSPAEIVTVTRSLLDRLLQHAPDGAGLVMCSQLHGMVFTTNDGQAASNFINWQDQRALQSFPGGHGSYFDEVNRRLTPEERRQLGNEPRPGVPLCYLFWFAQNKLLPAQTAVISALLRRLICDRLGQAHRLAASEEDPLLGLWVLSLAFSGRFSSVTDAIAFARKHYQAPS
jgi:sugar (pentulose or hexulose) kinase